MTYSRCDKPRPDPVGPPRAEFARDQSQQDRGHAGGAFGALRAGVRRAGGEDDGVDRGEPMSR